MGWKFNGFKKNRLEWNHTLVFLINSCKLRPLGTELNSRYPILG
jgi:hypothetical protein